jgi:glycosyltransferase involved in cell wall biosynthesis
VWAGNNQLSNLFVLPRQAARQHLDVVVFQNFPSWGGKFKKIAYIHDILHLSHPHFYTWKEQLYFRPLPPLARRADLICTISEEEKKRIIRHYKTVRDDQIDVIYHGVSPAFKPKEQFPASYLQRLVEQYALSDRFLFFVGRLNIRKNIQNLLAALPQLHDRQIPLLVAGSKDWKTVDFEKLIADLNLVGRVRFLGNVPDQDLPGIYALATVFCFPSYAEGFGLPLIESMASGVPVVTSNATCLPEIGGEAGTYFDPDSSHEIAAAIDGLLGNPDAYRTKRELGFRRARQFRWEKSAAGLLQSILKVCS